MFVTFTSHTGTIKGVVAWNETVLSYRNSDIYSTTGTTHTKVSTPSYGTVLVNGGAQTGTTLNVDGLTGLPQIGDTFSIAGVEMEWRARVAQLEAQIKESEAKSKETNIQIQKVYVDKVRVVKEKQIVVQEKIVEKEKIIDAECKVVPETITILNDAINTGVKK